MDEENKQLLMGGEPSSGSEVLAFAWEIVKIVAVSLIIILPIRYYVVQPFSVKGASMESNFEDGDYIFVNELSYDFSSPARGDVIIFHYPLDQTQFFIKRIIGLSGETIDIRDNKVTIYNDKNPNGVVLSEPYLDVDQQTLGVVHVTLDSRSYFVLGDNRMRSSDSRTWGVLNRSLITGKAAIRLWPFSKFELVPHPSYSI